MLLELAGVETFYGASQALFGVNLAMAEGEAVALMGRNGMDGILFVLFEFALGGLTEHWQLFLGLILLAVVLFGRGGLIGLLAGKVRHG